MTDETTHTHPGQPGRTEGNIAAGDVSGQGIAIGYGAQISVTINVDEAAQCQGSLIEMNPAGLALIEATHDQVVDEVVYPAGPISPAPSSTPPSLPIVTSKAYAD